MTTIKQRCFKIPKNRLDLFLTAIYMNFTQSGYAPQAQYIFQNEDYYDVVVGFNKIWDEMENEMEAFIQKMEVSALESQTKNHEVDCRCAGCVRLFHLREAEKEKS